MIELRDQSKKIGTKKAGSYTGFDDVAVADAVVYRCNLEKTIMESIIQQFFNMLREIKELDHDEGYRAETSGKLGEYELDELQSNLAGKLEALNQRLAEALSEVQSAYSAVVKDIQHVLKGIETIASDLEPNITGLFYTYGLPVPTPKPSAQKKTAEEEKEEALQTISADGNINKQALYRIAARDQSRPVDQRLLYSYLSVPAKDRNDFEASSHEMISNFGEFYSEIMKPIFRAAHGLFKGHAGIADQERKIDAVINGSGAQRLHEALSNYLLINSQFSEIISGGAHVSQYDIARALINGLTPKIQQKTGEFNAYIENGDVVRDQSPFNTNPLLTRPTPF